MVVLDPSLIAVLAVAAFFLVWYYAAYVYSRRLARRIANELRDALLKWGGRSRVQPFGPTAFRMSTEDANPPFKEVSVTVTLRPREMPINWALGTAQGRRDAALAEASLRKSPRLGFEVVDPASRVGQRRARAKSAWSRVSVGGRDLLLDSDDELGARRVLEDFEPRLAPFHALHVTAGGTPGIAASFSVEEGHATQGLDVLRDLANRLTA